MDASEPFAALVIYSSTASLQAREAEVLVRSAESRA